MGKLQNAKSKFRATSKWKKFKKALKEQRQRDEITLRPLYKAWNLHHMNLDPNKYEDIRDESAFACLNKQTHQVVHFLYRYYCEDPEIINRLEALLSKMKTTNRGSKDVRE
jgi:hypothetical protein|nr:MAG TPA_asm: hypothetical protein [Caudoviricetes sp.]